MSSGAKWQWLFTHAPESWLAILCVVGFVAVLVTVAVLYFREEGSLSRGVRVLLAALRSVVLILIAAALLGPAIMKIRYTSQEPVVLLLLDDSASMSMQDVDAEKSRVAQVEDLLQRDNGAFMLALRRKGVVRVMTVDSDVRLRQVVGETPAASIALPTAGKVDVREAPPVPPMSGRGKATDLAQGIRDALQSVPNQPIAGLVLISDGRNTAGLDPRIAAAEAGKTKVPIYTIGVGSTKKPVNVRLRQLQTAELAFLGDPVVLRAELEATVSAATRASVTLHASAGGDSKLRLLETREVELRPDAGKQTVVFSHKPEAAGAVHYLAQVTPLPGELIETDNEKGALVRVVKQKARALLLAGKPSWDYRLLRNLLMRESTLELSCWLQSRSIHEPQPGTKPIRSLPQSSLEWKPYQLVVLLDPNPSRLPPRFFIHLEKWVRQNAGGLLYMPGPSYCSAVLGEGDSPLRRLLPVRLPQPFRPPRAGSRAAALQLTADGAAHPLAQVGDARGAIGQLWRRIPSVYWYVKSAEVQPGSLAILTAKEGERDHPILAAGRYGQGRTIFVGINGTWRWRSAPGELFERFWVQAVRYLLEGDLLRRQGAGRIDLDRERYHVGDSIRCTVRLFDTDAANAHGRLMATIFDAKGNTRTEALDAIPEQPGRFRGVLRAERAGPHRIEVAVPKVVEPLTTHAAVEPPNLEFDNPAMDEVLLRDIAARSGGRYMPLAELTEAPGFEASDPKPGETRPAAAGVSGLAGALPERRTPLYIPGEPKPLWDNAWFLALVVALLSLEWALRRRYRLL